MRTELVTIPTDTLPLDGAFYEPAGGATAGRVLLFHGNTMNFYVGAPRFLPPALTAIGTDTCSCCGMPEVKVPDGVALDRLRGVDGAVKECPIGRSCSMPATCSAWLTAINGCDSS